MSREVNKKVGVFLVGSRKSGTTSLANFLSKHPEVSLSSIKEPNYFSDPKNTSIDKYHSLFDWNKKIQLEASTNYTADPNKNISASIRSYNPQAKIIYIIRDPLARIKSHYRMSYERGDLNVTLNEALLSHKLLLNCSRFYSQIKNYIDCFGISNILILSSEKLNDPQTKISLVNFLELNYPFTKPMTNDNAADIDFRMPRSMDSLLNNKLYTFIKSIIPQSIVTKIKSKYFQIRNRKMSENLSGRSKKILQKELISEMNHLEKIVDFDISHWIKNLKNL